MRPRAAFLLAWLAAPLAAAPLERDLGQGLTYCRAHAVPADLPAHGARHPRVLDVRYVEGGPAAGAALLAWLKAEAAPRTPVFLLANDSTSGALLAPLDSPDAVPGLIILGPGAPGFEPDIAVRTSAAAERKAYQALERGATVQSLIEDNPDKPRNDEARLAREHLSDSDAPDEAPETPAPKRPAKPVDAGLQRAVQLHRALLALKRL